MTADTLAEFNRWLLRVQYMLGVLAAVGGDVRGAAGQVSGIARQGTASLTRRLTPSAAPELGRRWVWGFGAGAGLFLAAVAVGAWFAARVH